MDTLNRNLTMFVGAVLVGVGPAEEWMPPWTSWGSKYSSRAKFLTIDIDKKPELFTHYRSGGGIPQIMIFKDGNIVAQQRGFGSTEGLN